MNSNTFFYMLDKHLTEQNGKIIHQVWFKDGIQNKRNAKKTYDKLKKYRDSWKRNNASWCHIEWDKELSKNLIKNCFPEHYNMYKSYKYDIQRCDMVRYCFLYRYGGLYVDMDYYCNKPFDEALYRFNHNFYLVCSPNVGNGYVSNSLMYSHKNHIFWKKMLVEMEIAKTYPSYYSRHMVIMYTTGPGILTRIYNKYKIQDRLKVLPSKLFNPYSISDAKIIKNKNIFCMHIGTGSWEKNDSKFFIILYRDWKIYIFIIITLMINLILK